MAKKVCLTTCELFSLLDHLFSLSYGGEEVVEKKRLEQTYSRKCCWQKHHGQECNSLHGGAVALRSGCDLAGICGEHSRIFRKLLAYASLSLGDMAIDLISSFS